MSDKLSGAVKKGECIIGSGITDPPYPTYVNFGTRYQRAQPCISTSYEVVTRKANGTFKDGMTKEIYKGLRKKYKIIISKNVSFEGTNLSASLDDGVEVSLEMLGDAGVSIAKGLCPVGKINGGRMRQSIMYKTSEKQGGFGV